MPRPKVFHQPTSLRSALSTAALFGALAIALSYSWMSPEVTAPNERTRLYLALSLLESGELHVDKQVKQFGKPFDISVRDGHFYTDKAPGSSVLAVPPLTIYKAVGGDMHSIERMVNDMRTFMMVPWALLTLFLLRYLLIGLGVQPTTAHRALVLFALGTSFFHYGAALYGHALVTSLALAAAAAMWAAWEGKTPRRRLAWQWAAGFFAGLAFAVEYQAVVIFIALFAGFLTIAENRKISSLAALGLGTLGPVAGALAYNNVAFGHPFQTSYDHLDQAFSRSNHDKGVWGVMLPTWDAVSGLLLSPSRGLLFCAPLVLLGVVGLAFIWRRARWLAVYSGVSMALYFLLVAGGKTFWFGGWSFGPRLLVPAFGLAALGAGVALAEIEKRSAVLKGALYGWLIAAVFYNVFVVSMFPELPFNYTSPLNSVAIPLAKSGAVSPNLGVTVFGLSGLASLLPLLVLVVALCVYVVREPVRATRIKGRFAIAALLTATLFFAALFAYPERESNEKSEEFVRWVSSLRPSPD